MTHTLYFAYGSNLSLARLRARAPSARMLGVHALPKHDLRFHKRGADGSGKCDAFHTGDDSHRVHGVLFALSRADKIILDGIEGLGRGYDEKRVVVIADEGGRVEATTYVATDIRPGLFPYAWYLNHVLVGAREAALPDSYIAASIAAVEAIDDGDRQREARERAIHA